MSEKKKNQVDNPDLPIEEQIVAQIKKRLQWLLVKKQWWEMKQLLQKE